MYKFILVLAIVGLLFAGCASVQESEFWSHSSHYKNLDHLKFSWGGYKDAKCNDVTQSYAEDWWGIGVDIPVCVRDCEE